MKKSISIALMLIIALGAMAQRTLPFSVQRFLDERALGMGRLSSLVPSVIVDGQETVDAFIALDSDETAARLKAFGVDVQAEFDGFVTARIPVDRLVQVCRLPGVANVEIGQKVQLCTDSTLSVTRAGQVLDGLHNGLPASYDGTGVVVGMIDTGFDFQHRAFRYTDDPSRTRIVRVYNTKNTTGHPAKSSQGAKLPGSVFIDDEVYGLQYDVTGTHGTHTTSIAAGAHVGGYGGMAPGADIVLCAVSVLDGGLSTVEIANCVRYIDAYCDSVGKPCVMSMSVSTPAGQHDGEDYLSRAVAQVVGPGRIFVIAASNNGASPMYAHKLTTPSNPINLLLKTKTTSNVDSSYYYSGLLADMWMRNIRTRLLYKFHILDQTTGRIVWESDELSANTYIGASQLAGYYTYDASVDTTGYIKGYVETSSNGKKYNVNISVRNLVTTSYTTSNGVKKSRYAIGMSIYPRTETSSELDAWLNHGTSRFASFNKPVITMSGDTIENFYTPSNNDCTIGTYAVHDSIISAGAFAARNSYYSLLQNKIVTDNSYVVGDIAAFSSFQIAGAGPTGEPLPTICAPGVDVVAAASRYSFLANHTTTVMKTPEGDAWGALTGTSMSAPTVAGIIALWLQANPRLSVSQIKDIIATTAIRDNFTMGEHHNAFGPNGKIDALAGMKMVLRQIHHDPGDFNGDGYVTIDDLTLMISYLLGRIDPNAVYIEENGDLDHNGQIEISDVTALISKLLTH